MSLRFILLRGIAWLVVFLALFSGALIVLFETGALTPYVVESIDARVRPVGLSFRAGSIQWRPWSGLGVHDVQVETVAAADSGQVRRVVSIRRVDAGYRLVDLLRGDLRVARVQILGPVVDLDALLDWSEQLPAAETDPSASREAAEGASFRVDGIRIADGRVRAGGGDAVTGLELSGSLETAPGIWRLDLTRQRARLHLNRFDEDVSVRGGVTLAQGVVELNDIRVEAAGGTITLGGTVDPRGGRDMHALVGVQSVPLEKVGEWLGVEHPLLFARLDGDAVITGRPDSLHITAALTGRDADALERRIEIAGVRSGNRVVLDRFRFEAAGSRVDVNGALEFGETTRIEGVAVFRDLEPAILLADPDLDVLNDLDGTVRFAGSGLTRATFRGDVDVHLDGATAFGLRFGEGSLHGALDRGALDVPAARFTVAGSELRGHGTIDRDNVVDAELRGDLADLTALGQIGAAVRATAPRGHGQVTVTVKGPVNEPELEAVLRLEDASVAGMVASRLSITAEALRLGATRVEFRAGGTDVGRGARRFDRVIAEGWNEADVLELRSLEAETDVASLSLAARLDFGAEGTLDAQVSRLRLAAKDGSSDWTNHGGVRIVRDSSTVSITGLDLRGRGGSVSGDVTVLPGGRTHVRAVGKSVDLELFAPFFDTESVVAGVADFDGTAVVGADTLGADVTVEMHDGRLGGREIASLSGRVVAGPSVRISNVQVTTPEISGTLEGEFDPPRGALPRALVDRDARIAALEGTTLRGVRASVTSSDFTWLWNRIPKAPVTGGEGRVQARLDGPFLHPEAHLDAELTGGAVGSEPLDSFVVAADFDGETLRLRDGLLKTGEDSLAVSGVIPLAWTAADPRPRLRAGREMDLRLAAHDFPLQTLSRTISLFQALQGRADATLALTGEPGSLHFGGDFAIREGRLTIPTFDEPLVDGRGEGTFDAEGIHIKTAQFSDGRGGLLAGEGDVLLKDLRPTDYTLNVRAREYHYRSDLIDTRAVGSGTLKILARPTSTGRMVPFYQGNFRVERADMGPGALTPPGTETTGLGADLPPGVVAPPELSSPEGGVEFGPAAPSSAQPVTFLAEIGLEGDGNLWLKTPEMDLELAADVVFHAKEWGMGLSGEVRTLRGSYSVLNTRFDVDRAEVDFTDPSDPSESYIDAEASTTVLDENVTAYVTGQILDPNIRLETDSGMTEAEIYELLALRVKRGGDPGAAEPDAFRNSYVAALTNRFGGELGRELGLDTFTYDEGSGSRSSVTVGKNVGRDFFFKYRQAVGGQDQERDPSATRETLDSPERALTIEYRLNRIFMLQGETGTVPPGEDYLNVDLRAEWGY